MISAKKLIKLARKWQKLAVLRRKRISFRQPSASQDGNSCSVYAEKGHFVVYSIDQQRFVLPLSYLKTEIVRELFSLAEEEFGLSGDGPLTLPCDSDFMEHIIRLIRKGGTKDMEKTLIDSISGRRCSSSSYLYTEQQKPICSF